MSRRLALAIDDADTLRALERHARGHPYGRIRKLLIRAGNEGHCSREQANQIHRQMRHLGFWDHEEPFPMEA